MKNYQELEQRFHRLLALRETAGMLEWDQSTMMPDGGRHARSEQLATIAVISHELLTDSKTGDLLDKAGEDHLNFWQTANLREMRRSYIHATSLDGKFVEAFSKARSVCEAVWREARPAGDFAMIKPHLEKIVSLVKEAAIRKAEKLHCSPYEALMDEYEPGLKIADVDRIFDDYAGFLPGFLKQVLDKQQAAGLPLRLKGLSQLLSNGLWVKKSWDIWVLILPMVGWILRFIPFAEECRKMCGSRHVTMRMNLSMP